jgi:hypothetical protein
VRPHLPEYAISWVDEELRYSVTGESECRLVHADQLEVEVSESADCSGGTVGDKARAIETYGWAVATVPLEGKTSLNYRIQYKLPAKYGTTSYCVTIRPGVGNIVVPQWVDDLSIVGSKNRISTPQLKTIVEAMITAASEPSVILRHRITITRRLAS